MARARNIKPSFFSNDELGDLDPLARLLFVGLWTIADFKGDLEWRSKRVKAQVLPYDECDVDALAISLDKSGFVRFYSDQQKTYLNIVNFKDHQNPHKNEREKGSAIPSYSEEMRQAIDFKGLAINPDKSGLKRNSSASDPADSLFPLPDSLILIPDSYTPQVSGSAEAEGICKSKSLSAQENQKSKTVKRFVKPSPKEVSDYCLERKNFVDPESFMNHYDSNGWRVGKNPMKCWKACVRTWEKNSKPLPAIKTSSEGRLTRDMSTEEMLTDLSWTGRSDEIKNQNRSTRDVSLEERINDKSWAD